MTLKKGNYTEAEIYSAFTFFIFLNVSSSLKR